MVQVLFVIFIAILQVYISSSHAKNLPTNIKPHFYDLNLKIDIDKETFSGIVKIEVTCVDETLTIVFHANLKLGLHIAEDNIAVNEIINGREISKRIQKFELDEENEQINLVMEEKLQKKHIYNLKIPFTVTISDKLTGLIVKKDSEKFAVISDFKRTYARNVFPCFDDIDMKAVFRLSIEYKTSGSRPTVVYSNTEVKSRQIIRQENAEWELAIFYDTKELVTYQLSFVVSNIKHKQLENVNTPLMSVFIDISEEQGREENKAMTEPAIKVVQEHRRSNINANVYQLRYVFLPFENEINIEKPGLIIKRESDYVNVKYIGVDYAMRFLSESAEKQIFGGTVTPASWTDQWLLDCLAKYRSYLLYPDIVLRSEISSKMLSVMKSDSLLKSRELNFGKETAIVEQEDSLQKLEKGLILLFMLDSIFSSSRMKTIMTQFVRLNLGTPVTQTEFWRVFNCHSTYTKGILWSTEVSLIPKGKSMTQIMEQWTSKSGYPVIHVERRGTNIIVTQSRFFGEERTRLNDGRSNDCWFIPLTWTSNAYYFYSFENTEPAAWLECNNVRSRYTVQKICLTCWIIFNNKMSGLYRVNYDEKSWQLIYDFLDYNYWKIHYLNRAHLISDALALAHVGEYSIGIKTAFKFVTHLRKTYETTNLAVWLSFFDGLDRYKRIIVKTEYYKTKYLAFIKSVVESIFQRLFPNGVQQLIKDDNNVAEYETKLLIHKESCFAGVSSCLFDSSRLYKTIILDQRAKRFAKGLFSSIVCTAVQEKYTKVKDVIDKIEKMEFMDINRKIFIEALSCMRNPTDMNWVFTWCFQPTEKEKKYVKERIDVFGRFLNGPFTYKEASAYFIKSYNDIKTYFRSWTPKGVPNAIPEFVKIIACETDEKVLSQFKELRGTNDELKEAITEEELNDCQSKYENDKKWLRIYGIDLESALVKS